jgi:hypothetical protein
MHRVMMAARRHHHLTLQSTWAELPLPLLPGDGGTTVVTAVCQLRALQAQVRVTVEAFHRMTTRDRLVLESVHVNNLDLPFLRVQCYLV